jgi:hypothetical protein
MVLFENSGSIGNSLDANSILIAEFNYAAQTAPFYFLFCYS